MIFLNIINSETETTGNSSQFFISQFHAFSLCHRKNYLLHNGCIDFRVQSRVSLCFFDKFNLYYLFYKLFTKVYHL